MWISGNENMWNVWHVKMRKCECKNESCFLFKYLKMWIFDNFSKSINNWKFQEVKVGKCCEFTINIIWKIWIREHVKMWICEYMNMWKCEDF